MTWTYNFELEDNPIDKYRFLIGDTDENAPIMQDEEIDYIIAQSNDNEDKILYLLFSRMATVFARDIKRSLGPQSEDPTKRTEYFREQAKMYKARMKCSGLSVPAFSHPKVFNKGMHNNPPVSGGV